MKQLIIIIILIASIYVLFKETSTQKSVSSKQELSSVDPVTLDRSSKAEFYALVNALDVLMAGFDNGPADHKDLSDGFMRLNEINRIRAKAGLSEIPKPQHTKDMLESLGRRYTK